ncbi:hypothetical protein C4Q31_14605 [Leptospira borgpetersenii serovar Ceylonica]|nr:hypothetical protein C4Q31_10500 [Leptospira borgpetersenii serovar Ceylonica]KGE24194.1 hypothetical protein IQ66_09335 [Leptospira borgpetersenii serovar Ballum]QHE27279.1 hypothetical protein GS524_10020 [Leptospira borgpetersenii]AXX16609.1 hypothetical protein C4Q31_14605 [Leptospira borgpetersenii serovar Ceylonica]OOV41048.1 hypothetical protein B1H38_18505 [Leptospira borgpetersenii serovar Ballum]
MVERIRLDPFRRNTLKSISGHATISVFKDLLIPITTLLSPDCRYGVKSKLITSLWQASFFYILAISTYTLLKKLTWISKYHTRCPNK